MITPVTVKNDLYAAIGALREAREILSDQIRGTNDRKYELCKEYSRIIANAEKAYEQLP